jgi:hypothetical protein
LHLKPLSQRLWRKNSHTTDLGSTPGSSSGSRGQHGSGYQEVSTASTVTVRMTILPLQVYRGTGAALTIDNKSGSTRLPVAGGYDLHTMLLGARPTCPHTVVDTATTQAIPASSNHSAVLAPQLCPSHSLAPAKHCAR